MNIDRISFEAECETARQYAQQLGFSLEGQVLRSILDDGVDVQQQVDLFTIISSEWNEIKGRVESDLSQSTGSECDDNPKSSPSTERLEAIRQKWTRKLFCSDI